MAPRRFPRYRLTLILGGPLPITALRTALQRWAAATIPPPDQLNQALVTQTLKRLDRLTLGDCHWDQRALYLVQSHSTSTPWAKLEAWLRHRRIPYDIFCLDTHYPTMQTHRWYRPAKPSHNSAPPVDPIQLYHQQFSSPSPLLPPAQFLLPATPDKD